MVSSQTMNIHGMKMKLHHRDFDRPNLSPVRTAFHFVAGGHTRIIRANNKAGFFHTASLYHRLANMGN